MEYVDVVALVEINIRIEENSLYCLDGFDSEFANRMHKKGGGIAMFIQKHINYERLIIETTSFENLTLKMQHNTKERVISAIYRPPKNNKNAFIEEFSKVTSTKQLHNDLLIMGDMNLNINDNSSYEVRYYQDMLASNGLCNIIKGATRVDPNIGSCTLIDHIMYSEPVRH